MLTNLQVLAAGFFMYDLLLPPGLNPIKNGPFRGHSRMECWSGGGEKSPTSLNLSHVSYNYVIWHSCTLPKKKIYIYIYKSRDSPLEFC